jgi:hypothetical protein
LRAIHAKSRIGLRPSSADLLSGAKFGYHFEDLIGQGAAQERAVVGATPNLAARLQALAEPGTVVIGPSTRRLTGGLFDYEDLGAVEVKGFSAPVMASRVLRESGAESRFEAQACGSSRPSGFRRKEVSPGPNARRAFPTAKGCVLAFSTIRSGTPAACCARRRPGSPAGISMV